MALKDIRLDLENHLGSRIKLKANRGRKKTIVREGILERTYPHVFTVRLDENNSSIPRVSYSYIDILTSSIELEYLDN
ncbi:Veg family protein [Clostridium sp. 'deep sea']|uniref:Veg family protein n=1 Tax=Clostridium sp. 'deep sea' TaxID=2779445 RepID=UPI00189662C8|nr:Veg family protein [Clostridium sp. 'deep sea']QOR37000.1 Veg family protein [Clostridium sp. 'deep sea']